MLEPEQKGLTVFPPATDPASVLDSVGRVSVCDGFDIILSRAHALSSDAKGDVLDSIATMVALEGRYAYRERNFFPEADDNLGNCFRVLRHRVHTCCRCNGNGDTGGNLQNPAKFQPSCADPHAILKAIALPTRNSAAARHRGRLRGARRSPGSPPRRRPSSCSRALSSAARCAGSTASPTAPASLPSC